MAKAVTEIHFVGGELVVIEEPPDELGRGHVTANGMVQAKELNGGTVFIKPENVTFVRVREV
jgi:hypothetical protein